MAPKDISKMHLGLSCTSTSQPLFKHIYWEMVISASVLGLLLPLQGPEPTRAPSRVYSNRTPGLWSLLPLGETCTTSQSQSRSPGAPL